jgi:hypothetical protein
MTEQEQIQEMAKLIDGSECPSEKCPKMDKEQVKAFGACNIHRAQILYNAGYRKAEDVRKETARECLKILYNIGCNYATSDFDIGWNNAIKKVYRKISQKYGVTAFDEEGEE